MKNIEAENIKTKLFNIILDAGEDVNVLSAYLESLEKAKDIIENGSSIEINGRTHYGKTINVLNGATIIDGKVIWDDKVDGLINKCRLPGLIKVYGDVTIENCDKSVSVSGNATFKKDANIGGRFSSDGGTTVGNDLRVEGRIACDVLNVKRDFYSKGRVASGNTNIEGDLNTEDRVAADNLKCKDVNSKGEVKILGKAEYIEKA